MGKGIGTHHGFVGLHHKTGGLAHHAAGRQDVLRLDAQGQAEIVFAGFHRHDNFFQGTVTGAFPQAVDGAFHLPRTANLHTSQRVGDRHAQIVVAMHRPNRLVGIGNAFAQGFDEVAVQLGDGITHRVGHVDGGGALFDNSFQDTAQIVHITAVTVFWAEFHIGHQVAGKPHRLLGLFKHLVGCHAQLLFHVQGRSGDEGVNPRVVGAFQGFCGP